MSATVLVSLLSFAGGTEAQFGGKILRKGNIDAATKMGKAAVLTDQEVQQLSLQSVAWMDANNTVARGGDVYAERLKRLVVGLEREEGLHLNFAVYLVTDVNAFASPDGSVRVMAGLMNLMTDAELRSVIGHEIGHVKLNHSKKQYQKAYSVAAGRDAAIANTGSASVIPEGKLGEFVEGLLNAKFSRGDESEADEWGFGFMVRHDYDYHAMQTAFLKLGALAGDQAKSSLQSTHPASDERAAAAKKSADEEDKKRAAAQPADPPESEATPEAPPEEAAEETPKQDPEQAPEMAPDPTPEAPAD